MHGRNTRFSSNIRAALDEFTHVVATTCRAFGDERTAFFDLFRVDNGKIAEHRDVIADIPKMAHGNRKF